MSLPATKSENSAGKQSEKKPRVLTLEESQKVIKDQATKVATLQKQNEELQNRVTEQAQTIEKNSRSALRLQNMDAKTIQELNERITTLQGQLKEQARNDGLKERSANLKRELEKTQERVKTLEAQLRQNRMDGMEILDRKTQDLEILRTEVKALKETIAQKDLAIEDLEKKINEPRMSVSLETDQKSD